MNRNSNIRGNKSLILLSFLVGIITFLVYLPALQNGFVNWDDPTYVYENPRIRELNFGFIGWAFSSVYFSNWHPLTMISYALDYAVWGLNPFGYHLTNIIFHTANTLLVFILAVRLIECRTLSSSFILHPSSLISGAIIALLFGIHPLHVESVAWISARKDVLCAFFFLLSLLAYVNYASAESKNLKSYVLSLFSFIFALMSKPMAVSLPMVLLILDFYLNSYEKQFVAHSNENHPSPQSSPSEGRGSLKASSPLARDGQGGGISAEKKRVIRHSFIDKIPFILLSLIAALMTIWAQHQGGALPPLDVYPLGTRFLLAIRAYAFYLLKILFPFSLAPFYPPETKINPIAFEYLVSAFMLLLITYFIIRSFLFKNNKLCLSVWLYYTVTLIPVIGIVKVGGHTMADRYIYMPGLGVLLLAGIGITSLFDKNAFAKTSAVAFLVLLSGILINKSIRQIYIWHDSVTLWSHEIELYPDTAYLAYVNRGIAYNSLGRYNQAISDFTKAVEINPRDPVAYQNRGSLYYNIGNHRLALEDYGTAAKINPNEAEVYNSLGRVHKDMGEIEKAEEQFRKALKLRPSYPEALNNLGTVYYEKGLPDKAEELYEMVISLNPSHSEAHNNLGSVYLGKGLHEDALREFETALRIRPDYAEAHYNIGNIYYKKGRIEDALKYYDAASRLKPDLVGPYFKRGNIFFSRRELNKALMEIQTAARFKPDSPEIFYNMGIIYLESGDTDMAKKEFESALSLKPDYDAAREAINQLPK